MAGRKRAKAVAERYVDADGVEWVTISHPDTTGESAVTLEAFDQEGGWADKGWFEVSESASEGAEG